MPTSVKLIAITGGSGSGKTWLANHLQRALGPDASRLSLDDFYLDQSHLATEQRELVNYDDPGAMDWDALAAVLRDCRAGTPTPVPRYNFATHTRRPGPENWTPGPIVLMDGLWLLLKPSIRGFFDLAIFLECPLQLRLERRLSRDVAERGRTPDSVRTRFWNTVAPMDECFIAPQARRADVILAQPSDEGEIARLTGMIRAIGTRMHRLHPQLN